MKILIDTNIIIDYLAARQPFAEESTEIMRLCMEKKILGFIAAHTLLNAFFILRKSIPDSAQRRRQLFRICKFVSIVSINEDMLTKSLENYSFKDFEDCVQAECALRAGADYIVTRNVKDFEKSPIKAITPDEFIKEMES